MLWGFQHQQFRDGGCGACMVLSNRWRRLGPECHAAGQVWPLGTGLPPAVSQLGASPAQVLGRASPAFPFKDKSVMYKKKTEKM